VVTPDLTATLKRHLMGLRTEALRQGTGEPGWLFPRADGALMNKDYATGVFRRILKRAGLPHYRVYDLRHTFASLLLAESAPITYVAAQLGHSSPATTMRFYARWIPSKGQRWVDALDRKPGGRARQSAARAGRRKVEPENGTNAGRA
jgi:integrase